MKRLPCSLIAAIAALMMLAPLPAQALERPDEARTFFQLALFAPAQLFSAERASLGLRINLIYGNNVYLEGYDFGLINQVKEDHRGIGLGLVNLAGRDLGGFQIGLLNQVGREVFNVQVGVVNWADAASGAQLGLVNRARLSKGFQLGLVNWSERMTGGAQLGLINVARKNDWPVLPILRIHF